MSVQYISQDQNPAAVNQNLQTKGFLDGSPSTGCTYVELPPAHYQALFQDLQKEIMSCNLPISCVRVPHATVIAAKVIDKKPSENWQELEAVQKIYQAFYLYHVKNQVDQGKEYHLAVLQALSIAEKTMGAIATKNSAADALKAIEDASVREIIAKTPISCYDDIKRKALESINNSAFTTPIAQVKLTNNGTIIIQLAEDPRLLQLRLDLIIAGEGISKWSNLSVMKNGWSTIGFTEKAIDVETKSKIDGLLKNWVETHQKELSSAFVKFDPKHLGSLAFRSNDFFIIKNMTFPLAKTAAITLEDLSFDQKIKQSEITPILGRRHRAEFAQVRWHRPINRAVTD